ncbi:hypothetical protein HMPREF1247_1449 [Atopobium sp. BV3Ac4]|nr:hypothetical protein HMPREF1247_1449 [Atopobium sp. BV3Ac4]
MVSIFYTNWLHLKPSYVNITRFTLCFEFKLNFKVCILHGVRKLNE